MRQASKTHNIRLQVMVEVGSLEDLVLELLNDEKSRPFGKSQMFLTALKPFWATLALLYKDFPPEQVVQVLNDGNYLWELHKQYLRERIESKNRSAAQLVPKAEISQTNWVTTLPTNFSSNTTQDQELMPGALATTTTASSEDSEAEAVAVEVVSDDVPTTKKGGSFNPFGDDIVIRN